MKPLLIAIEGLGIGAWLGASYIRNEIIPQVQDLVDVQVYSWAEPKPEFPLVRHTIFVGHSFGAAWLCANSKLIPAGNKIITIDPRWTGFDSFAIPPSFTWYNYYQRNIMWFPGCSVAGARNELVTGISHTEMPSYPPIVKIIREWAAAG